MLALIDKRFLSFYISDLKYVLTVKSIYHQTNDVRLQGQTDI